MLKPAVISSIATTSSIIISARLVISAALRSMWVWTNVIFSSFTSLLSSFIPFIFRTFIRLKRIIIGTIHFIFYLPGFFFSMEKGSVFRILNSSTDSKKISRTQGVAAVISFARTSRITERETEQVQCTAESADGRNGLLSLGIALSFRCHHDSFTPRPL